MEVKATVFCSVKPGLRIVGSWRVKRRFTARSLDHPAPAMIGFFGQVRPAALTALMLGMRLNAAFVQTECVYVCMKIICIVLRVAFAMAAEQMHKDPQAFQRTS